ncbi:MAG: carboxypeptidase-like regulatory domain-containing protein [Cyclobacteriaceae bacterium]
MKTFRYTHFLFLIVIAAITACGSEDEGTPTIGQLTGVVSDAMSSFELENANVIVFNADDNSPVASKATAVDGQFSFDLPPGNYFVKVARQGYISVPAPGLTAVPFTVTAGETTQNDVAMLLSDETDTGWITGKVLSASSGVSGVLVVAESGNTAYSAISDEEGNFTIFNVPSGDFLINGWKSGYNSEGSNVFVSVGQESTDVNVTLTEGASGSLSGQVRNIASENKDVDVALVHPVTRETIPGLVGETLNQNYVISNIPNGVYIARATFSNDSRVMDPDRIFKFGEPYVEMAGSGITLDFDITNSVQLATPDNEPVSTLPVEVTSATPVFEWTPYSSTSDYVIEVTDAMTGTVIWGGFDTSGDLPVKKVTIPGNQLTAEFNFDGSASINALEAGKIYRWRIYASKNDQNSPTGWTLISASEDQHGLIRLMP